MDFLFADYSYLDTHTIETPSDAQLASLTTSEYNILESVPITDISLKQRSRCRFHRLVFKHIV